MQGVLSRIHSANMKALLVSRMNLIVLVVNGLAIIALLIAWGIQWGKEDAGFLSRYAVCIISLVFIIIASILSIFVHRSQPKLSLFYAHEVFAVLSLILTAIAMGTNDVVVNLCHTGSNLPKTQCGAHIVELLADLFICIAISASFLTTQQRIVTFIDKGILDGIKGRSNGMTELP